MTDTTVTTVADTASAIPSENNDPAPNTPDDNAVKTKTNANSNGNATSSTHIEFEPPQACIRRLLKTSLPPSTNVAKDASSAFSRASGIFILYLTTCANDFAREGKRSTIIAKDVLNAVKELGFGEDFGETLEKFLEGHRREETEKKREKERMKERLSGGTGEGEGGRGEAGVMGKGILRGADGKFTERAANSTKDGEGIRDEDGVAAASAGKGRDGPEEEGPSPKRQKLGNDDGHGDGDVDVDGDGDGDGDADDQNLENDEG
ncbi:hypothetical protein ACHAXS_008408 [Conticribra weissflogii]